MSGIYFYWVSWLLWAMVTFILPKDKSRTVLAIWILLTIIVSNFYISIADFEFSISYLAVVIGGFVLLARLKQKGLQIFSAITIMIGFTSLLIWETNAPVWVFMPRLVIIPLICMILTIFVNKQFINRITISIIGLCSGEFLYNLLLINYSITQTIGDRNFLDTLFINIFLLISIEVLRQVKDRVMLSFKINNV
ncbi:YphA family membrane protein [Paucisalibacillus globulus]|uniref:YphA family membrane protein n=1 Tax=Paucisalibacillus globulus TaxID=351095 RepID=UPI000BB724F9|nr:hypothetical protein [Paucisalibacillus globulus]